MFQAKDIIEFEKKHEYMLAGRKSLIAESGLCKSRSNKHQQARKRCREVAHELIKKDPQIDSIKIAIDNPRMQEAATRENGAKYQDKTIRNWIKNLFPKHARRHGRRS